MGKAQAAGNVSIDDLLASIRQAIHEEVEAPAVNGKGSAGHFRRAPALMASQGPKASLYRTSKDPLDPKPGSTVMAPRRIGAGRAPMPKAAGGREGVAAILGGDVRLEEALARLSRAGRLPEAEAAAEPMPRARRAELRPALVDDVGGAMTADLDPIGSRESGPSEPEVAAAPRFGKSSLAARAGGGAAMNGRERHRMPSMESAMRGIEEAPRFPKLEPALESVLPHLLSPSASDSATAAFNRLAEALAGRSAGADRVLEDATRDLLLPLLKSWLDEHLPAIVERLVREEIERVARRGTR